MQEHHQTPTLPGPFNSALALQPRAPLSYANPLLSHILVQTITPPNNLVLPTHTAPSVPQDAAQCMLPTGCTVERPLPVLLNELNEDELRSTLLMLANMSSGLGEVTMRAVNAEIEQKQRRLAGIQDRSGGRDAWRGGEPDGRS